jgi:hypothetical protein
MEARLGISLYTYTYLSGEKCFVFLIIVYTLSSTKLEIRAEQILPETRWVVGRERGCGVGGRNGPNIVCTYE